MKKITIFLFVAIGIFSCSESEDGGPDNSVIASIKVDDKKIDFTKSTIVNTRNQKDTLFMMIFALHTDGIEYDPDLGSFRGSGDLMFSNFTSPVGSGIASGTYTHDWGNHTNFHFRGGMLGIDLDVQSLNDENIYVFLGGEATFSRSGNEYTFTPAMEAEPYIDFENDITDPNKRITISGNFQVTPAFMVALEE